jgi:hypothetical protein
MAFNEQTADRIRCALFEKRTDISEKQMFGGICFMADNKMCCGTRTDKKTGEELLLCRIGEVRYEEALEMDDVIPMEFTGRSMKGYVYVTQDGFRTGKKLNYWLQLCLDYNPLAKKSKKRP